MSYTRNEILAMCRGEAQHIHTFYQAPCVNYRGRCSDTGELYTETIAAFVCRHMDRFRTQIPKITRSAPYRQDTHDGKFDPASNRLEEILAMKMFNHCKDGGTYLGIGKIIDYQTPLKNKRSDETGKIDLLAYDGNVLRILELKKPDSEETMLRCVLEGFTYLQTVDTQKLLSDFALPSGTIVAASPLVYCKGLQWAELNEDRPHLKDLMRQMEIEPFALDENNIVIERYETNAREVKNIT